MADIEERTEFEILADAKENGTDDFELAKMTAPIGDSILTGARLAAVKAWNEAVFKIPYTPLSADAVLDIVLAAAAPVFRRGYLSLAHSALKKAADAILAYNEYQEGLRHGAQSSVLVVKRLRDGQ